MCEPIKQLKHMEDNIIQDYLDNDSKLNDTVNKPDHYTSHPSGVECIDIAEHYDFCIGNVIKYIWRNGLKEGNTNLQELLKARFYLNREIVKLISEEYGKLGDSGEQRNR